MTDSPNTPAQPASCASPRYSKVHLAKWPATIDGERERTVIVVDAPEFPSPMATEYARLHLVDAISGLISALNATFERVRQHGDAQAFDFKRPPNLHVWEGAK